jgi:hypothetical protein
MKFDKEKEEEERWEYLTQRSPKGSSDEDDSVGRNCTCGECYWGGVDQWIRKQETFGEKIANRVESYVANLAELEGKVNEIVTFYEEQEEKEVAALTEAAREKHFENKEKHLENKENDDAFKKVSNKKVEHPYGRDPPEHWDKINYEVDSALLEVCEHCNENPCLMVTYEKEFDDFSDSLIGTGQAPRACRYASYRFMVRLIHGVLPKGDRRKLPLCITREIHDNFPESDGNYVGFLSQK